MKGPTIPTAGGRGVAGVWILYSILLGPLSLFAFAGEAPRLAHGLWVWKSPTVLEAPRGVETLWEFCKSEDINEVYISISARSEASEESQLAHLIVLLHRSDIRVEALLSSTDADEPGKHRERLLDRVREIMHSISGIRRSASMGFTSMWSRSNGRRTKAQGTFDSCRVWRMLFARCGSWRNWPG